MHITQYHWNGNTWLSRATAPPTEGTGRLTLIFGERHVLDDTALCARLLAPFAGHEVILTSTAGHFIGDEVHNAPLVATTIAFDSVRVETASFDATGPDSATIGRTIAGHFAHREEAPRLLYILSDGGLVNGTELIEGVNAFVPEGTVVAGGLAGDNDRFERTLVGLNGAPAQGRVVVAAFFGADLVVSTGTASGWQPFGPSRTVTASEKNTLAGLDDKAALELYKKYLGPRAEELPGSALLFPLEVSDPGGGPAVIRTVLGVDHEQGTMTFAGNVPQGSSARFMCAHFDQLIASAGAAARQTTNGSDGHGAGLALVMSCVGRRMVLGQRVDEELAEALANLSPGTEMTGFYSYGEVAPGVAHGPAQFHNQTITITTLHERKAA